MVVNPERVITDSDGDHSVDVMPKMEMVCRLVDEKGGAERRLARLRRAILDSILAVQAAAVVGDWTHLVVQ